MCPSLASTLLIKLNTPSGPSVRTQVRSGRSSLGKHKTDHYTALGEGCDSANTSESGFCPADHMPPRDAQETSIKRVQTPDCSVHSLTVTHQSQYTQTFIQSMGQNHHHDDSVWQRANGQRTAPRIRQGGSFAHGTRPVQGGARKTERTPQNTLHADQTHGTQAPHAAEPVAHRARTNGQA